MRNKDVKELYRVLSNLESITEKIINKDLSISEFHKLNGEYCERFTPIFKNEVFEEGSLKLAFDRARNQLTNIIFFNENYSMENVPKMLNGVKQEYNKYKSQIEDHINQHYIETKAE